MSIEETFTEVYQEYSSMVMKSVVAQTGDVELGNEICQNVFMSYYRYIDEIEEGYIKAWLLQVTKNQLIDYWRKKQIHNEFLIDHISEEILVGRKSIDAEKCGCDRLFLCELMEDLKKTNPHWYDVVDCICVREMKVEEASAYLKMPPGVLRGKLHRARKYIREKYGKDW